MDMAQYNDVLEQVRMLDNIIKDTRDDEAITKALARNSRVAIAITVMRPCTITWLLVALVLVLVRVAGREEGGLELSKANVHPR